MNPVRVLGLDGMSLPLLHQLVKAGLMPAAEALLETCDSGPLRSTIPFSTIPGWGSIFTGVLPGEHGQLWWKKDDPWLPWPTSRERGFTSFHDSHRPPLWQLLDSLDYETAFLDVPASFPAPTTKGIFVAGFLGPWPHPQAVHPAELRSLTSGWLESDAGIGDASNRPPSELARAVEALSEATQQRRELYSSTFRSSCDLTFQVLVGPDRLSHVCWPDLLPESAGSEELAQAVSNYWRSVDEYFVPLLKALEQGETVIVCSDHGSTSPPSLRFQLFPWLLAHEYVPVGRSTTSVHAANQLGEGLERVRRRVLPVARRLGLQNVGRRIKDKTRELAWKASRGNADASRVFGTILGDHEAGFFINPAEINPSALATDLMSQLRVETHSGVPIFPQVGPAESFLGPLSSRDRIPDVVAITREDIGAAVGLRGGDVLTEETNRSRGVHQRSGIYLIGSDKAGAAVDAGVEDITPTVLALLDVDPPVWMHGRSLVEASPTKKVAGFGPDKSKFKRDLSPEEERAIEDHLRGLGYVE